MRKHNEGSLQNQLKYSHYTYMHSRICLCSLFLLPEVLAAPCPSMWPKSPRLWPTWPGHLAAAHAPTSPPWRPHVGMPSATLWTPTAWWDASPAAPTTASTWKPSAAQDTSQSADIMDSHPVRKKTSIYTCKKYMHAYLRVWSKRWMIRLNIWCEKTFCNLKRGGGFVIFEPITANHSYFTTIYHPRNIQLKWLVYVKSTLSKTHSCRSLLSNKPQALS